MMGRQSEEGGAEGSKRLLVQQMRGMADYEQALKQTKSALFQQAFDGLASRRTVEVGVGHGVNFPFMREVGVKELVAVDPNQYFSPFALEAASRDGLELTIKQGVMEDLPFETASVDVLVGTLLLCSVSDVEKAVSEAYRVLRPGGRYIFVEHTAAPSGSWLVMVQSVLDYAQQVTAAGCHLTRDPLPLITATFGQQHVFADRGQVVLGDGKSPIFPHFLLSPYVSGYAVKSLRLHDEQD